ncbi:MAG: response regulator [Planctomycetaceae bacterium]|nr:response regulator [Planctomycetaceae bacterium]
MKPPVCVSPASAAPAISLPAASAPTVVPCRRLLIVDDDPADVFLARQALSLFDEGLQIDDVSDGQQALEFLQQRGHKTGPPLPHFLLLDINMPRLNGLDTLKAIRSDDRLKSLPVIILTTSTAPNDIQRAWDLQATCYLSKQLELDAFTQQLQHLVGFWGRAVCYPE